MISTNEQRQQLKENNLWERVTKGVKLIFLSKKWKKNVWQEENTESERYAPTRGGLKSSPHFLVLQAVEETSFSEEESERIDAHQDCGPQWYCTGITHEKREKKWKDCFNTAASLSF